MPSAILCVSRGCGIFCRIILGGNENQRKIKVWAKKGTSNPRGCPEVPFRHHKEDQNGTSSGSKTGQQAGQKRDIWANPEPRVGVSPEGNQQTHMTNNNEQQQKETAAAENNYQENSRTKEPIPAQTKRGCSIEHPL